jgi:hypothetical protein
LSLHHSQFGLWILQPHKASRTVHRPKFLHSRTSEMRRIGVGMLRPWSLCWRTTSLSPEDGSTFSKSGYIAHNGGLDPSRRNYRNVGSKYSHARERAVVTGAYHEKGKSKGKPYEYRDRFTDVWMNKNGRWQVIASHYSIPAD